MKDEACVIIAVDYVTSQANVAKPRAEMTVGNAEMKTTVSFVVNKDILLETVNIATKLHNNRNREMTMG